MPLDEVRQAWRDNPRSTLTWTRCSDQSGNAGGECCGDFVQADGFSFKAYRKPGKAGRPDGMWPWPLAAYEKIAADLAYELQCPVQVMQVQELDVVEGGYTKYTCLSLKEYPQYWPWSLIEQVTTTDTPIAALVGSFFAQASGMLVLDTWLGQSDRGDHPNNVLLGYDPAERARTKLCYIDFGRTLNWQNTWVGDGWKQVSVCEQPSRVMNAIDKPLVNAVLDRMTDMQEEAINDICNRLIGPYFTAEQANFSAAALNGRRELVRQPILNKLAAL